MSADSDEGTAEGLLAYGAEQTTDIPVMAIDVLTVNDAEAPSDLKISMVTHRAEMRAYSNPEPFLAKYDDLIRKYYRTIAEQGRKKGD